MLYDLTDFSNSYCVPNPNSPNNGIILLEAILSIGFNDVMAVRIFAEPNLFAFLGTYKRDASENFQTTLLHCWGLTQSMLVRRYKKISKYR